jgi:hypothetical protein
MELGQHIYFTSEDKMKEMHCNNRRQSGESTLKIFEIICEYHLLSLFKM